MKHILLILALNTFPFLMIAQNTNTLSDKPDSAKKILLAEVSCGQCQFGLPGMDCNLAVRIDGRAYFVKGANIDSYGDAHANDGFCKAIRKAEVQGELLNNQFILSYFKLLETPMKSKSKK